MKKYLIYIAALALIAACNKVESPAPSQGSDVITAQIEQETATRTYMDVHNNIRWSEGDQIVGFMKSSLGLKYRILSSSVGKTSAFFEKVSSGNDYIGAGNEWDHNVVYYPYSSTIEAAKSGSNYVLDVVLPSEQTYAAESFGNGSMAMVAVSEDNDIVFRNVLGGMKLQLRGTQKVKSITLQGNDNEKLSGAATVTAYVGGAKPAIIMDQSASTSVILNCGSGVSLSEGTAEEFIISLPPVLFSKGFKVAVADIDGKIYTIQTDKANAVLRSSLLVMPEVRLGEQDADNSEIAVSEIHMDVTSLTLLPGTSYAVLAEVLPYDASDKTLAWSSDNDSVASVDQSGNVFAKSDGKAVITAAVGKVSANCVVRVKSETLTVPADYIDGHGVNYGKGIPVGDVIWAPVNCGYEPTEADYKGYPYGKLYQWGRKYGQGYSDWEYPELDDLFAPDFVDGPVNPDMEAPDEFYVANYFPYDWSEEPDDHFWNSGTEHAPVKTDQDPCPEGWRVPTYAELNALSQNSSPLTTNALQQNGYWCSGEYTYLDASPKIFLPAAGERNADDVAGGRRWVGCYWTSMPGDAYYAMALIVSDYAAYMSDYSRGDGFSVRCVQD